MANMDDLGRVSGVQPLADGPFDLDALHRRDVLESVLGPEESADNKPPNRREAGNRAKRTQFGALARVSSFKCEAGQGTAFGAPRKSLKNRGRARVSSRASVQNEPNLQRAKIATNALLKGSYEGIRGLCRRKKRSQFGELNRESQVSSVKFQDTSHLPLGPSCGTPYGPRPRGGKLGPAKAGLTTSGTSCKTNPIRGGREWQQVPLRKGITANQSQGGGWKNEPNFQRGLGCFPVRSCSGLKTMPCFIGRADGLFCHKALSNMQLQIFERCLALNEQQ